MIGKFHKIALFWINFFLEKLCQNYFFSISLQKKNVFSGDEMGMIEDMTIGIQDLKKVKIQVCSVVFKEFIMRKIKKIFSL